MLLATRQQETTFSNQSIVSIRQLRHESIGVGFGACLPDQGELLFLWSVLPLGTNEAVSDIVLDGSGEEDRFLGDETDLATKPLDVKLPDIDAIQSNDTRQWVIEPLNQGDDGGLSRPRSANQGNCGSSFDGERKIFDDRDIGARWVAELDILESDTTFATFGLQPSRVSRVDGGDTINGGK